MRKLDEAIAQAWRDAADDLGIRVIAPFDVATEPGETITYEAFIPDFGGPAGTVTGVLDDPFPDPVRASRGYYASNLGPSYQQYRRDHFIATLNDWQWFGDERLKPNWYTGERWS
jgi:hypothetical protein